MSDTEKLNIIEEIVSWETFDAGTKVYFTQSFLLGWTGAEHIHGLTERDRAEIERRNNA